MSSTSSPNQAKFTTGSTMRHVLVMTSTGSIGLIAIFLVDFANLFYISHLGVSELAAAIGYAGTLMFFNTAIGVGLSIAASATVSRKIGAGDKQRAGEMAALAIGTSFIIPALFIAAVYPFLGSLLSALGAKGTAYSFALSFLQIAIPSMPFLCVGMTMSALLRSVGDAKWAMTLTLSAGVITALLDPLFIFWMDLGTDGAAIVSAIARVGMALIGAYACFHVHKLIRMPNLSNIASDLKALSYVAVPAILTNISTPIGNAWVTSEIAQFGDESVAGWAVVGRIIPVAFGALFALSGAVGPILGQNLGAKLHLRLKHIMRDSIVFVGIYSFTAWGLLFLLKEPIATLFNAEGESRALILFFCSFAAAGFVFNGALFVTNAAFNNLGYPLYSTGFNWARATIGTIPFTVIGGMYFGANGVLAGQAIGGILFGVGALWLCIRTLNKLVKAQEGQTISFKASEIAQ
ncbi:MATE family efflux transporter [Flexibacterium corallicola]|uniref:MATE family efflux transporter n=1 Tax=Flexibacterium corallicola TaxID=3037259 RepID=UPI00286F9D8D|nr:MATE family efflux transporter [Pseudovibrio sp. M1P-2-3]